MSQSINLFPKSGNRRSVTKFTSYLRQFPYISHMTEFVVVEIAEWSELLSYGTVNWRLSSSVCFALELPSLSRLSSCGLRFSGLHVQQSDSTVAKKSGRSINLFPTHDNHISVTRFRSHRRQIPYISHMIEFVIIETISVPAEFPHFGECFLGSHNAVLMSEIRRLVISRYDLVMVELAGMLQSTLSSD
jgi:hypothetical protein